MLKSLVARYLPPPLRQRLSRLRAQRPGAETPLDRVARIWGETAVQRAKNPVRGWLDSVIVLEQCVQPKQSGSPHVTWLMGLAEQLPIPRGGR